MHESFPPHRQPAMQPRTAPAATPEIAPRPRCRPSSSSSALHPIEARAEPPPHEHIDSVFLSHPQEGFPHPSQRKEFEPGPRAALSSTVSLASLPNLAQRATAVPGLPEAAAFAWKRVIRHRKYKAVPRARSPENASRVYSPDQALDGLQRVETISSPFY